MDETALPAERETRSLGKPLCPWCGQLFDPPARHGILACPECGNGIHLHTATQYDCWATPQHVLDHHRTNHPDGGECDRPECDPWDDSEPYRADRHAKNIEENKALHPLWKARSVPRHWQNRVCALLAKAGYSPYGAPDTQAFGLAHPEPQGLPNPVTVPGLWIRPYLWDWTPANDGTDQPANLEWAGEHPLRLWWYKYALREATADRTIDDAYLETAFGEIEQAIKTARKKEGK